MYISKISNSVSFKKTQEQEPLVLRKLDDESIYELASFDSRVRLNKIASNSLKTVVFAVPAVDSLLAGMTKRGDLPSKISKSASVMGRWAKVFAAGFAVMGLKKYVNSKIEPLDNFDKKHRVLSFLLDLGFLYTALSGADSVLGAAKNAVKRIFPSAVKNFKSNAVEPIKQFVNKSKFNKKLVYAFDSFMNKHPHYAAAGKITALMAAPAIAIAAVLRFSNEAGNASKRVQNNYMYLKAFNEMIPEPQNETAEPAQPADN